jgi:hypothetical protein
MRFDFVSLKTVSQCYYPVACRAFSLDPSLSSPCTVLCIHACGDTLRHVCWYSFGATQLLERQNQPSEYTRSVGYTSLVSMLHGLQSRLRCHLHVEGREQSRVRIPGPSKGRMAAKALRVALLAPKRSELAHLETTTRKLHLPIIATKHHS